MSILPNSAFIVYLSEDCDHFPNFKNAYSFEGLTEKNFKIQAKGFAYSNLRIILKWEGNTAQTS